MYTKTKTINGQPEGKPERVDSAWVERFLDAADFFNGWGQPDEKHETHEDGTIVVTATDPLDSSVHVTTFRPHSVIVVSR